MVARCRLQGLQHTQAGTCQHTYETREFCAVSLYPQRDRLPAAVNSHSHPRGADQKQQQLSNRRGFLQRRRARRIHGHQMTPCGATSLHRLRSPRSTHAHHPCRPLTTGLFIPTPSLSDAASFSPSSSGPKRPRSTPSYVNPRIKARIEFLALSRPRAERTPAAGGPS